MLHQKHLAFSQRTPFLLPLSLFYHLPHSPPVCSPPQRSPVCTPFSQLPISPSYSGGCLPVFRIPSVYERRSSTQGAFSCTETIRDWAEFTGGHWHFILNSPGTYKSSRPWSRSWDRVWCRPVVCSSTQQQFTVLFLIFGRLFISYSPVFRACFGGAAGVRTDFVRGVVWSRRLIRMKLTVLLLLGLVCATTAFPSLGRRFTIEELVSVFVSVFSDVCVCVGVGVWGREIKKRKWVSKWCVYVFVPPQKKKKKKKIKCQQLCLILNGTYLPYYYLRRHSYLGVGLLDFTILVMTFTFSSYIVHYVLAYVLEVSKTVWFNKFSKCSSKSQRESFVSRALLVTGKDKLEIWSGTKMWTKMLVCICKISNLYHFCLCDRNVT